MRADEWYSFDRVPSGHGAHILATLDETSYDPAPATARMGKPHPIVRTRCIGRGRVIFSGLGHKAESYSGPLHLALIRGAVRWASRRAGKGCA